MERLSGALRPETVWLLLHWLAWLWLLALILVVLRLHGDL